MFGRFRPPDGRLFAAKRLGGVDAGGAQCRYLARCQRGDPQKRDHTNIRRRVCGCDAEQHAIQHARHGERQADAERQPDDNEPRSFTQHALDVGLPGAERETNTEFPTPLRDQIREHAVNPEHGDEHRRAGKRRGQHERHPSGCDGLRDHIVDGPESRRYLRRDLLNDPPGVGHDHRRVDGCLQHQAEIERAERTLPIVGVEGWQRLRIEAALPHVADDADDGEEAEIAIHAAVFDLFPDRVPRRPSRAREPTR